MLIRSHPVLSRFLIWIVFPIVIVLGLAYGFLLQSLPQKEGVLRFEGLNSPVKITRDKHAIPHIYAETDHDAFFAIGYLHAQDRLWQMNYMRRIGQGRVSEILGRNGIASDRYFRTLGLYPASQTALESLDEFARESLIAYANGVNAWIKEGNTLPIEFHILDTEPELWQPADSLLFIKIMARTLGNNYNRELAFNLLVQELGIAKANEIVPNVNPGNPTVTEFIGLADKEIGQGLLAELDQLPSQYHIGDDGLGSNAWAVSGQFTESGLPLLASDPHLRIQIPAIWYMAEIQGGRLHVTGATHPGTPLVLMGHNESIAWGNTNMIADVQDLYVERTNPLNEDQYEVDGQWVDMEINEELIYVKSDFPQFLTNPIPPLKLEVRKTRHGPLISDAIGRVEQPLALKWAALDEQDKSYESFLDINYAENLTHFKSALEDYTAPALNFIYADIHGNIGLFSGAKVPIRRHGNGRLPVPGWDSKYDWDGYIPWESLPQVLNPEKGYVVNANNRNHPIDYPYIIANSWSPPYRVERISQTIENYIQAGRKITVQDFIDLQGNVESRQAEGLLSFFKNLTPQNPEQAKVIDRLRQWNGLMSKDSREAAIYQVWLRHFNAALLTDDFEGGLLHEARSNELLDFAQNLHPEFVRRVVNQHESIQSNWCDKINTEAQETCEELALSALGSALTEFDRYIGSNKGWGDIHELYYPHETFVNTQLLDSFFDRAVSNRGDRFTVNNANWGYTEDDGYRTIAAGNYRQVIDLNNWNQSGFINSTGQSGNVLSKHYDDNIVPYNQLKLWPMHLEGKQSSGKESTLWLEPSSSSEGKGSLK